MAEKIILAADRLYLIRSTKTKPSGEVEVRYYESPSVWNKSPLLATLFQDYDNGQRHLAMYRRRDAPKKGWADGSSELLDVVPLYGEILQSPNGIEVQP